MAIGDKAASKGLAVFPSTQNHGLGYQNDNQRGDDIADVIDLIERRFTVQNATPSGTGHVIGDVWIKSAT
ncbi:hypothetical protein [Leifsonia poae]|uniref:hypothetical protein n=1 Tax=Leifsonia poae TaxID=110933 RepID=UPI001CC16C39|nr:hypothetical protein [Leifsonia poae]